MMKVNPVIKVLLLRVLLPLLIHRVLFARGLFGTKKLANNELIRQTFNRFIWARAFLHTIVNDKVNILATLFLGSNLNYNTSARHERHECNASNTSVTRVQHV